MNKLRKLYAWLCALVALLLVTLPARADITISAAPDASTLTTSLNTAYGLAVGVGLASLGVGFVVYMIRKGVKVRA